MIALAEFVFTRQGATMSIAEAVAFAISMFVFLYTIAQISSMRGDRK